MAYLQIITLQCFGLLLIQGIRRHNVFFKVSFRVVLGSSYFLYETILPSLKGSLRFNHSWHPSSCLYLRHQLRIALSVNLLFRCFLHESTGVIVGLLHAAHCAYHGLLGSSSLITHQLLLIRQSHFDIKNISSFLIELFMSFVMVLIFPHVLKYMLSSIWNNLLRRLLIHKFQINIDNWFIRSFSTFENVLRFLFGGELFWLDNFIATGDGII